jgi:hypothetical protein
MFWFGRRVMSRSWLADQARKETCEGWNRDSVVWWLKSEDKEKRRAAFRTRVQVWCDARWTKKSL